jgi:hypothetical protein
METITHTTTGTALLDQPRTQRAFEAAKSSIRASGALSAVALLTVIVVASSGHMVNSFMWARAVLLAVLAVLLYRMTVSAAQGSRRAFERVNVLAVTLPIAIGGVDLIPGICPLWYAAMQVVCVLPIVRVAFLTRRPAVRAAFPKKR